MHAHACTESESLESEGDALLSTGQLGEALQKFLAAEALDQQRPALYDKLIATHRQLTVEWTHEDFTQSLTWEMRKQALEHPEVLDTLERLTPEWQEVTERLRRLLVTTDEHMIATLVTEIAAFKEKAVRPLLDFLLLLKTSAQSSDTAPAETPPEDVL